MYDGVAGVREIQNRQNHHTLSDKERLADKSSIGSATQREALVYDILNCGPRHRFVVRGLSGPFIVHNCVQKISRDILARGMIKAEEAGFEMVLHVHDELVAESGEDDEELDDKYLSKLLATNPPWALGLPLAAAGHSTSRYAKE